MSDVACVVWSERQRAWFVEWIHWRAKPLGPFVDEAAARALANRINGIVGTLRRCRVEMENTQAAEDDGRKAAQQRATNRRT